MTIISAEMKYANAVKSLRAGCEFIAEASGITRWDSPDLEQPSESDIQAEIVKLQAEYDSQAYSRARANEYPPITDYLDGVVKGDQAQIDKYIADCLAVKDKYPK